MQSKYRAKRCLVTADGTLFELDELKRHNITDIEGIRFDSKMEAMYYQFLTELKRTGYVRDIELQPAFILQDKPKITYKADFRVTYSNGVEQIVDVKGVQTKEFRLKVKMLKAKYPDISLILATRKGSHWVYVDA